MSEHTVFQDNLMNVGNSGFGGGTAQGEMEEAALEVGVDGMAPPMVLAPPVVHSQHASEVKGAAVSEGAPKKTDSVKNRRQRYKTNRPISARQQATKRNEPPGLSAAESLRKNMNLEQQSNIEQTPTVQRLTKKKFRHQSSYEEAPEPEEELPTNIVNTVPAATEASAQVKAEPTETHPQAEPMGTTEQQDASQGLRTTKPRKWLPEEDEMLRKAVQEHGAKHWKNIAQLVPGRSHVQCLQRWNKVLKPGLRKGPWTAEEDGILTSLVEGNDHVNWTDVSNQIFGRSAKQCRERWYFNLDPRIKKGEWTEAEDNTLINAQLKHGNRWAHISTLLPGRTENAVKTRFKSIMRAKKREWSSEEDEQLLQLQRTLGSKWEEIAKKMPNRTKNAVKTRFKSLTEQNNDAGALPIQNLHVSLKQESLTPEEYSSYVRSNVEVSSQQYVPAGDMGRKLELDRCQSAVIPDNYVPTGVPDRKLLQKFYTTEPQAHHQEDMTISPPLQPPASMHFEPEQGHSVVAQNMHEPLQEPNMRERPGGEHSVDNILYDLANMDARLVDSIRGEEVNPMPSQQYVNPDVSPIKLKDETFATSESRPEPPRPNLRSLSGLSSLLFTSDNSLVESDAGSNPPNAVFGVTNNLADHDDFRIPDVDQNGQQENRGGDQVYSGGDYRRNRTRPRRRGMDNQKCRIS